MNVLSFLPSLLEIALVIGAAKTFMPRKFLIPRPRWWCMALFFVALALMAISIFLGGRAVALMAIKVIFFALTIAFALCQPRAARSWLLVSVAIELIAQATAGNVLNKLATVPFLLMACLWVASRARLGMREFLIIVLALSAETIQALALESRGLLLAVVIAGVMLLGPLRFVRRAVATSAALLPVVYPLILTFISVALLSGSNLLAATSSNFERSAMAAWSIMNLSTYPLVGPGGSVFVEQIDIIKILGEQAVQDAYDPHQFLLSAWIWLGTSVIAVLYIAWCAIWLSKGGALQGTTDGKIRVFSILAFLAIFTFILSPPDTSRRVQVALLTGIAIAGLSDPSILRKKRTVYLAHQDR